MLHRLASIIAVFSIIVFSEDLLAEPSITLNAPLAPLFGIYPNLNHGFITENCGYKHASEIIGANCLRSSPYGAWIDGPLNPYRYAGNTYFQIAHSENFRIKIPNSNWGNRETWSMEGTYLTGSSVTPAQRDTIESHYNNKNWIFSVYSENNILYGLTHHEWYRQTYSINYVNGFRSGFRAGMRHNSVRIGGFNEDNTPWIASIGWLKSLDGGNSWIMRPTSEGSARLITVPQPSDWSTNLETYGFMHPSNIVKEGNYYYVFTSTFNYGSAGQQKHGVALFRTENIATPMSWQFWNGQSWTVINHNTYQGNFGPQMPYVFWGKGERNYCTHLYAMNVRKHKTSGKWITLGSKYCLPMPSPGQDFQFQAVFSWVDSLANPVNLENNLTDVQQNGLSLNSNFYYSFFDVDGSADDNYQSVGDHPLLVVTKDYDTYYHQFITLSGF